MKKRARIFSMFLALAMVFTMLIMPSVEPVKADGGKEIKYSSSIKISRGNPYVYVNLGKKWKENKKLTVKSSNKNVVRVEEKGFPVLYLKKNGTATVTFKTGGKTYRMKFTVVSYKNPFKTFKFGGKSIKGQFKKFNDGYLQYTKDKAKIKITPNRGWKIKSIKYKAYKYSGEKVKSYTKKLKNNSSVTFKGSSWDAHFIVVKMYNKSKNFTETVELGIDRYDEEY